MMYKYNAARTVIGHCPECCLEEMRRVRDEIEEGGGDGDSQSETASQRRERRRRHKEKKKRKKKESSRRRERDRDRDRDRGGERSRPDADGGGRGGRRDADGGMSPPRSGDQFGDSASSDVGSAHEPLPAHGVPRRGHYPQDGSENTGSSSTAPESMSAGGNGSVSSGQYDPRGGYGGGGGGGGYDPPNGRGISPAPFLGSAPGPNRTMVLSMAFTDPRTGHRGTYTGQVNSVNHRPDGKGTVYYANGSIAEGTWRDGQLVAPDDDAGSAGGGGGRPVGVPQRGHHPPPGAPPRKKATSFHGGDAPRRRRDSSRESHRSSSRPKERRRGGGDDGRDRSTSRTRSRHPAGDAGGGFTGNLDRLDQLGGAPRRGGPRGASASVQSYNSRGDEFGDAGNFSGSASVQHQQYDARGGGSFHGGYGGGGGRPQQSSSFHGRSGGSFHGRPGGSYR